MPDVYMQELILCCVWGRCKWNFFSLSIFPSLSRKEKRYEKLHWNRLNAGSFFYAHPLHWGKHLSRTWNKSSRYGEEVGRQRKLECIFLNNTAITWSNYRFVAIKCCVKKEWKSGAAECMCMWDYEAAIDTENVMWMRKLVLNGFMY